MAQQKSTIPMVLQRNRRERGEGRKRERIRL
jgi:hypothetical protein